MLMLFAKSEKVVCFINVTETTQNNFSRISKNDEMLVN